MAPLLVLVIAFVAFSLPPYLTFDPARSRVPIAGAVRGYYPMLVAHVDLRIDRHPHLLPADLAVAADAATRTSTGAPAWSTCSPACCRPARSAWSSAR